MKNLRKIIRSLIIPFILIIITLNEVSAQQLYVGAAMRETTPKKEWLPLSGTARTKLVGIIDPIHVRVIAVGNGDTPALIVTFEAGGPASPETFLTGLSEHTGVPVDAIYYGGTHCHSAPSARIEPDVPSSVLYTKFVYEQLVNAAEEAIANMKPATIGIGYTDSYINVNRQRIYHQVDGKEISAQGYNPKGPSDKTLSVIRFEDMQGKPIAFIVHYAVHNTVMYANKFTQDGTGISADIAGAVSSAIEKKFVGSVASWIPGASGDQNPLISNEYFTPNPETGKQEIQMMSRAVNELVEFYGKVQFTDVLTALANISDVTNEAKVSFAYGTSALPAWEAGQPDFNIYLKLLRIGNIGLVGNPAEIFNSTGVYMKEHSLLKHTLVSNQNRSYVEGQGDIYTSYIPDDYALINDGWHTNTKRYKIGTVDGGFTILMNKLIESTE